MGRSHRVQITMLCSVTDSNIFHTLLSLLCMLRSSPGLVTLLKHPIHFILSFLIIQFSKRGCVAILWLDFHIISDTPDVI